MSLPCRLLATCSADQTCKIWRTSNFSLMTELSIKSNNPGETSRGWMWDCAFSGDSQYIVTGEALTALLPLARGLIWMTPGPRQQGPALAPDLAVSLAGTLPNPRAPAYAGRAHPASHPQHSPLTPVSVLPVLQ